MQAEDPLAGATNLDGGSVKVVIVYDHLETAKRAEEIYERLAERLGHNFEFELRLWRFDVLDDEGFRAEAARDTADADIVIVATYTDAELPPGVQNWLESSLQHRTAGAALVALLQHSGAPVTPYLQDVARRSGMDFFAQAPSEPRLPKVLHAPAFPRSRNGHPRSLANN